MIVGEGGMVEVHRSRARRPRIAVEPWQEEGRKGRHRAWTKDDLRAHRKRVAKRRAKKGYG